VRRRRSGRLHLNAEINVVSLIDVMMLLLVIFMITAPLMQGGVDVKLPVASARPLDDKSSVVVTIDRNGRIFVGKDGMNYSEFQAAFKSLAGRAGSRGVTVRSDGRANVEMLVRVLAVIRNAGITNVGIATEEEAAPR
jgi:biopolymer transport protein ExbD/biopolymer transport protein TolR